MEISLKVHKESNQDKGTTTSKDQFPCLSIFLPILQNEHEAEIARTDRVDNKSIALLTIIIALITVYLPIFPIKEIVCIIKTGGMCCGALCLFYFLLLLGIIAILTAMYTAKKLIAIYKPAEYNTINIQYFNNNDILSHNPPYTFQLELIDHYQKTILANSKTNTDKASIIQKQVVHIIIIFILLSVSAIGLNVFAGMY